MSIGSRIKARRKALGMSQEMLARELGSTQTNVSRIESNNRGPGSDMLIRIAEALRCDVRELLGVEMDGPPEVQVGDDAREFVGRALASDPELAVYMRSFVSGERSFSEEDWKFLASSLKLALGYAADTIEARRVKGSF